MKTYLLLFLLLVIGHGLGGQSFDEKFESQDIQIEITMTFNGAPHGFYSRAAFNKQGQVTLIQSLALAIDEDLYAEYTYLNNSKIDQELVYKVDADEGQKVRRTNYVYHGDSTFVKVEDDKGLLKSKFVEIHFDDDRVERQCLVDKLNRKNTSEIHQTQTTFYYENGKLKSYELTSFDSDYALKLQIESSSRGDKVEYRTIRDTIDYAFDHYRLYDKEGRLSHISSKRNKRNWFKRFIYDKKGMLSAIEGKGKMLSTGEKVRRDLIFNVRIKQGVDLKADAVRKINAELINLYHPITGRMLNLNYMDSRRFISQQS